MQRRPATPVIAGVGQVANKDDDRVVHPVDLIAEAVEVARADSGAGRPLLDRVGLVVATPLSVFDDHDAGELVAARLGLVGVAAHETRYSGAAPQRALAAAARQLAAGELDAALVVGGVAEASVKRARAQGEEPPAPPTAMWSQGSRAATTDPRVKGGAHPGPIAEIAAGGELPVHFFALLESAIGAAAGHDVAAHRAALGELMAPFTRVAASRPDLAWSPVERRPEEIAEPSADNRMVAEPYTKRMCSFPTVDLAAAVLVCRADVADAVGVRREGRVHPWAMASVRGPVPSRWPELHRAPALHRAVAAVLERTGARASDLGALDLYSCFPAAVQLGLEALGIPVDDPRPFTLTGGLPYFGGPGASYSLHGLVAAVEHLRVEPARPVGIVGLGGMAHDYSVGLYGAAPCEAPTDLDDVEPPTEGLVPFAPTAAGRAVVEAVTVVHPPDGPPRAAPMLARLPDGARVGARAADPEVVAAVAGRTLVGTEVELTSTDGGVTYRLA